MNISRPTISTQFKIGYGENFDLWPQSLNDHWNIQFARCQRSVENIWVECQLQALSYKNQFQEKINFFYSGGIDSEFALLSFKEARVPVRVLTAHFANGLNSHDLEFVKKFRIENPEFTYESIDIDIEKFLLSAEAEQLSDQTQCTLPHLLLLMSLMKKTQAPLIMATGEPYLKKEGSKWFLRERESIASLYRFFYLYNIKGTHAFFQSTPELFFSYLTDPVLKSLAQNEYVGKLSSMSSRHKLYNQYAHLDERPKYHGYEKLESLIAEIQKKAEDKYSRFCNMKYFLYDDLVQGLKAAV